MERLILPMIQLILVLYLLKSLLVLHKISERSLKKVVIIILLYIIIQFIQIILYRTITLFQVINIIFCVCILFKVKEKLVILKAFVKAKNKREQKERLEKIKRESLDDIIDVDIKELD